MRSTCLIPLMVTASLIPAPGRTENFTTRVDMYEKSAATFYVAGMITGYGNVEFMVDTGSGYMTINERTLEALENAGTVRYVRELQGILADGNTLQVPVYAIEEVSIGDKCWLRDVEAAVFPGNARQILGLSALRKASPFIFSTDPPSLELSGCGSTSLPEVAWTAADSEIEAPALTPTP